MNGSESRSDGPPRVTSKSVWIVLGNALALAVLLLLVWQLRVLVSWILVALLLALAAQPAVAFLTRHGFKHVFAVITVCVVALGTIAGLVGSFVPMLVEQGRELAERAPELLRRLQEAEFVRWAEERMQLVTRIEEALGDLGPGAASSALNVARQVIQGLAGFLTILVLTVFMLLFGSGVINGALAFFSPKQSAHLRELGEKMVHVVGGYVLGTLLVATVGGIVMGLTMLFVGAPYFLPLGLLMIVLGLIPYIGGAMGALLTVGVTFAAAGIKAGLIVAGVYLGYQQIEGQILQPLVQRRTLSMNPLIVTLALLGGAMLAGVLGALLALPIAGAVQVILRDALARREQQRVEGLWLPERARHEDAPPAMTPSHREG